MQTTALSNTSEPLRGNDSTTSKVSSELVMSELFVTAASPQLNNATTSIAKSNLCDLSTPKPRSLPTLGRVSTIKEKDLNPYWDEFCRAKSLELLSPTEIDSLALPLKSSNISFCKAVENSWFSTDLKIAPKKNLPEISSTSFTYSHVVFTDSEDTAVRSKKIRIYPTAEQRAIYRSWLDSSRYVYNQTVQRLKVHVGKTPNWMGAFGKSILAELPAFAESAPYQIKKVAIRDATFALAEGKRRVRNGLIPSFELGFRSRKASTQSCFIPSSAIKESGIYPRLSRGELFVSESLPIELSDSRLVKCGERWYLCVPSKMQRRDSENQGRVVAIDPGVRNFATLFSESILGHIGKGDIGRISNLCRHLDRLKDRKAAVRMRTKIRNLVDELHWKTIKFLVSTFDVILLPFFKSSEMVVKKKRKLRKKSVRSMLTLSHYRFSQRLIEKAFEHGKTVIRVNEAYTSKTNSWTGEIMPTLGGRKSFRFGDVTIDRDINGARGIFLRALRDTSFTPSRSDAS